MRRRDRTRERGSPIDRARAGAEPAARAENAKRARSVWTVPASSRDRVAR
jgi:hypothetical protein